MLPLYVTFLSYFLFIHAIIASTYWAKVFLTNKVCKEEYNATADRKWPTTLCYESTTSEPHCINNENETVYRYCDLKKWDAEPECKGVQQDQMPPCPDNFIYHHGQELCYQLTEKMPFPPKCPSKNVVPFNYTRTILDELTENESIWIPVQRDYSNGIGFLQWTEFSFNYKKIFTEDFKYVQSNALLEANCLVYSNNVFEGVSCNDTYRGICAYQKLSTSHSYCKEKMVVCRQRSYKDDDTCFCAQYVSSSTKDDPNFPLAEITLKYQNEIIKTLTSDNCLIGLRRSTYQNDSFIWVNSKTILDYDYWAKDSNISDLQNVQGVFTQSRWILVPDHVDTKCFIYEREVNSEEPKLHLSFNNSEKRFELQIEHENDLKEFVEGNDTKVYCFTDATNVPEIIYRYPKLDTVDNVMTFDYVRQGPGYYWCEAVNYKTFEVIRSDKVLYKSELDHGFEFVAIIVNNYIEGADVISTEMINTIQKVFSIQLPDFKVRVFKILDLDEGHSEITFNMHFTDSPVNTNFFERFILLYEELKDISELEAESFNIKIQDFASADFCRSEEYKNVSWPTTPLGGYAVPDSLCVTKNNLLLKRRCLGNFIDGAQWEKLEQTCAIVNTSSVTEELYELLSPDLTPDKVINGLHNITTVYKNYSTLDVYIMSEVFTKVEVIPEDCLEKFINTTSSISSLDKNTFALAQKDFNATDRILDSLDITLSKLDVSASNPEISKRSNNTLLYACDITSVNFDGILLTKNETGHDLHVLPQNTKIDALMDDPSFEAAVIIPDALQQQIIKSTTSEVKKLVFVVYLLDTLFNPTEDESKPSKTNNVSQIFDILIPGFNDHFAAPIQIYYKRDSVDVNSSCAYWYFGKSSSFWKNESDPNFHSGYEKCVFWHVTHFALLLVDDPAIEDLNYNYLLDIITDINCMLSMFGLIAILFTAILFKRWRTNPGNKILINFVFAIAFQISLLYISDSIHKYVKLDDLCTIVGAMLHYSIISEFCWMLIIAILQFKRFVEVFGVQPKYMMWKTCVTGWILPLFPVLCILFLDPKCYVKNKVGLCYPSGLSLYLSIWLPVGIIVSINAVIFTYILYSVSVRSADCLIDNNEMYYQWRLAFLLFFMLGLTWSFGLLIQLDFGILFVYLFTFSATLQGFIMFLFFIIFNKNTRVLYTHYIKNLLAAGKLK